MGFRRVEGILEVQIDGLGHSVEVGANLVVGAAFNAVVIGEEAPRNGAIGDEVGSVDALQFNGSGQLRIPISDLVLFLLQTTCFGVRGCARRLIGDEAEPVRIV